MENKCKLLVMECSFDDDIKVPFKMRISKIKNEKDLKNQVDKVINELSEIYKYYNEEDDIYRREFLEDCIEILNEIVEINERELWVSNGNWDFVVKIENGIENENSFEF